jgi:hypothetical protein
VFEDGDDRLFCSVVEHQSGHCLRISRNGFDVFAMSLAWGDAGQDELPTEGLV